MRSLYKCKSKGTGEVAIMEIAVKMTREGENLEVAETKKRKKRDGDMEISPTVARVRSTHSGVFVAPVSEVSSNGNTVLSKPDMISNFDDALASCLADNGSSDITKGSSKVVDLDEDSVEIATTNSEFRESRETKLSSEFKVELHKLEYSTRRPQHAKPRRRLFTEAKMPSETDLDEFFAAAERDLHKRFAEKYNFDFAKEEPLEGRYEWVRQ
ncbi:hypothetical protein RND71_011525 [Anisodus tanguticus]|uniref:Cyclin-dependent kinase inhibitor n=1 Tax=Anisodus tanguticus TaxID=243964 RepID=A0AAE1VF62_9SOLA|nr:hypothetical protein RND71_011525 [Anisodus tanguticus]